MTTGPNVGALVMAAAGLGAGPAVLRDHVKSMKHSWDEAAYLPEVTDTTADYGSVTVSPELREDAFTGGSSYDTSRC